MEDYQANVGGKADMLLIMNKSHQMEDSKTHEDVKLYYRDY